MVYNIILGRGEADRQKFGTLGTIFLGKQYIQMGQVTALSSPIYLDVTRSHVVFVCGKRGGGKCLHGDTLITLDDGRQLPIRDLEGEVARVMALNHDLKLVGASTHGFYKRKVHSLLEIQTRLGRTICVTPEHPLLTIDGWKSAESLDVGSRIATPRTIPTSGTMDMDEHRVKLLAYLIAEGHLGNNFILFTNTDERIIGDFKESIRSFDSKLDVRPHGRGTLRVIAKERKPESGVGILRDQHGKFMRGTVFDRHNTLRAWFIKESVYGKKSRDKEIPASVMRLPRHKLSIFLNRLFSCDGSIWQDCSHGGWRIQYTSASETLARQVAHLLLRFGIPSKLRQKIIRREDRQFTAWTVDLRGASVRDYLQHIGFFGAKEKRQLEAFHRSICISANPNIDTIPKEIWGSVDAARFEEIGVAAGYSTPAAFQYSTHYSPSREKLQLVAKVLGDRRLTALAASDILWDEITAVTRMDGNFDVYDITVPGNHNFIANDIIVHNSYSMGVIAEGISDLPPEIRQNISVIMMDTMGVYWTMKYPNLKDEELLNEWKLKAKGLDITIFTPVGYYNQYKSEGIPTDLPFSIKPSELSPEDWFLTFDLNPNEPVAVLIERVVLDLKSKGQNFDISDILAAIKADTRSEKNFKDAAENRFLACLNWGVFSKEGTPLSELAKGGRVTVLDMSAYATQPGGWKIKALVLGIVAMRIFIDRMIARKTEEYDQIKSTVHYLTEEAKAKKQKPMVWLVVDEAHEFMPLEGKTAASEGLITILREGRQPGVSLILATQQPGKIHTDVMTQSDILLAHHLTAKIDVDALGKLMQSYLREGLDFAVNSLPKVKGAALAVDDTNERMYPMKVRPRFTWHGGEAPTAMPPPGSEKPQL